MIEKTLFDLEEKVKTSMLSEEDIDLLIREASMLKEKEFTLELRKRIDEILNQNELHLFEKFRKRHSELIYKIMGAEITTDEMEEYEQICKWFDLYR